ncbi:WD40 repeat domain-containing protein [Streptomyces niveus]|uniref:WD40 repeat domain-containing protein n=1 Tax=Streptomyces niveus TaxID=193462 RepID=UPI00341AE187
MDPDGDRHRHPADDDGRRREEQPWTDEQRADDEQRTHARIAESLARFASPEGMAAPHPYLSRYLAHHAAIGGTLDDHHVPPGLLPWIAGDGVRNLLGLPHTHRREQSWLTAWSAIEPYLQGADLPSRYSSLHLAHTALWFSGVPYSRLPPEAAAFTGSRLRVLWSQWAPPTNVLTTLSTESLILTTAQGLDSAELLVAGTECGSIELIKTSTGAAVGDRIPAHDRAVRSLDFVPDPRGGGALVSGSMDGTVRIWDTYHGTLVDHMTLRKETWTAAVAGCRDEAGTLTVAAVDGRGGVTLWQEETGQRPLADLGPHPSDPSTFALTLTTDTADRQLLVGVGNSLRVWSVADRRLLHEHVIGTPVRTLISTSAPGRVVTGHSDGSITVWDVAEGIRADFPGDGHPVVSLVELRVDGLELLAAASPRAQIALWDINSGQWAGQLTGHTDRVTALCTLDGEQLVSTARDKTVRLWDAQALRGALGGTDTAPAATAAAITTEADTAPLLAVGYGSAHVEVWDTRRDSPVASFSTSPEHPVSALAWAPEEPGGRRLMWAAADHSIRCWDPGRDTDVGPSLKGHTLRVRALTSFVARDGRQLAISGSDDCTTRLWDLSDGRQLRKWKHALSVRAVAAVSDEKEGDLFASGGADGTVRLWGSTVSPVEHRLRCDQGVINAVAINARSTPLPPFVASGGDDGTVRLWELSDGAPLGEPLRGHTDVVEAIVTWTASDDASGQTRPFVASAARDGTVRIWEPVRSRCVLHLATGSRVRTLSVRPLGRSADGVVLVLAGEAGVAVLDLSGLLTS